MTAVIKYSPNAAAGSLSALKAILSGPSVMEAIAQVAPRFLTPERVVKMVLMAASRQPQLLECTQESILKSVMIASQLGLDCSGVTKRGYLVPFRSRHTGRLEAEFIPGYLGLMDLARRSGEIESIRAEVVYRDDHFEFDLGLTETLVHKRDIFSGQSDNDIVGAYMIARFRPSGHHIEFMTRLEIDKVRARSKAKDSGPWVTDFPAMAKKTVIRRGLKFCPISLDVHLMIAETDKEFDDASPQYMRDRGVLDISRLREGEAPPPKAPQEQVPTNSADSLPSGQPEQTSPEGLSRKRGRPPGSKNKPKPETPEPVIETSEEDVSRPDANTTTGTATIPENPASVMTDDEWQEEREALLDWILEEYSIASDHRATVSFLLAHHFGVSDLSGLPENLRPDLLKYGRSEWFHKELQVENIIPMSR